MSRVLNALAFLRDPDILHRMAAVFVVENIVLAAENSARSIENSARAVGNSARAEANSVRVWMGDDGGGDGDDDGVCGVVVQRVSENFPRLR